MLSSLEDSLEQRIKALQIKEDVLNSLFFELLLWDIHFQEHRLKQLIDYSRFSAC